MKRLLSGLATLVALTACLVVGVPQQALAGGGFSYTFDGLCCISTRHFTTVTENDIWFDVDSVSPCDTVQGDSGVDLLIELYKEDWGSNTNIGTDKSIENCSGDVKWSMVNAGEYYFKIWIKYPHRDTKSYTVKGNVAYDGSVT